MDKDQICILVIGMTKYISYKSQYHNGYPICKEAYNKALPYVIMEAGKYSLLQAGPIGWRPLNANVSVLNGKLSGWRPRKADVPI